MRSTTAGVLSHLVLPWLLLGAAALPAQPTDPIVGTWRLDVGRSTFAPALGAAPPRELVEVLRAVGGDRIELRQRVIRGDGTPAVIRVAVPAQGGSVTLLEAPGTEGLTFVESRLRAGHWLVTVLRDGRQLFVREKIVSADGRSKRETVRGVDERGHPFEQIEVYERLDPPLAGASPGTDAAEVVRVVQAQVDAYNRRDLEAFLAVLAPDVRLYAFPDSLLYAGRDTLRVVYGRLFATASGLRADVTARLVQGAHVLDQETTHGLPGARGPLTGVAIYEVRRGRVTRIWFLE